MILFNYAPYNVRGVDKNASLFYEKGTPAHFIKFTVLLIDHLCGLLVRIPGYISRGPSSIPRVTRFSEN
jgi:hypothetical protein